MARAISKLSASSYYYYMFILKSRRVFAPPGLVTSWLYSGYKVPTATGELFVWSEKRFENHRPRMLLGHQDFSFARLCSHLPCGKAWLLMIARPKHYNPVQLNCAYLVQTYLYARKYLFRLLKITFLLH